MEEDLRTRILGGSGVPSRVHWLVRPQGSAIPAVVLTMVSRTPSYTMDGADGLQFSRVQVDVFASTYSEAKTAARAVETRVSGYSGTTGSTEFQLIQIDGERDIFEAGANDADTFARVSLDLLIHHRSA